MLFRTWVSWIFLRWYPWRCLADEQVQPRGHPTKKPRIAHAQCKSRPYPGRLDQNVGCHLHIHRVQIGVVLVQCIVCVQCVWGGWVGCTN
jgi:hypothetical protein